MEERAESTEREGIEEGGRGECWRDGGRKVGVKGGQKEGEGRREEEGGVLLLLALDYCQI